MSGRELDPGFESAARQRVVRPALFARIGTASGDVRVWAGYGEVEFQGEIYTGVGEFGQVAPVQETADVYATGTQFILNGVNPATISSALGEMLQGQPAKLWLALLDDDGTVAGSHLLFSGLTDVPRIDDPGDTATISITAEHRLIRLKTPNVRRFTNEDQQLDHPGDLGFEYVPGLQEAEFRWGS